MNETWMGYCDLCDKTVNTKNKSRHINSISHIHKEKFNVVVKECEFRADINKIGCARESCSRKWFFTYNNNKKF